MSAALEADAVVATTPRSRAKIVRGLEDRGEVRCMSGSSSIGRRCAVVGAVGLALALSACGSDASDGQTSDPLPAPSSSQSDSPEPEPTVSASDDEAEILAVYHAHWDARVAAQKGNPDPALFDGNTVGPLVEEEVARARTFEQYDIVREGAPSFSEVSVSVDGDFAQVTACVDFSAWVVPEAEVDPDVPEVIPSTADVERIDGQWLVTNVVETDLAC